MIGRKKKIFLKVRTRTLLCDTNCDRENNDYKNALCLHRFKSCDFSTTKILYDIVPYARHFLPVKIFSQESL